MYTALMQALGASAKVFEYMHREPEIDNTGAHAPTDFKGQIRFDNVSFAYPTREDNLVLKVCHYGICSYCTFYTD